jgi:hypothetical protein
MSDIKRMKKRELKRSELEKVLLNPNFIGDIESISSMMNPKVLYTVLNKIQKVNNIKL